MRLEREKDEEVRLERRQRKRAHRKHREAYQVLLDELCRQGLITSMAKWKSVFPIIRNDSRFLNMQVCRLCGINHLPFCISHSFQ